MINIYKWFKKDKVLCISSAGMLIFFAFMYAPIVRLCPQYNYTCGDNYEAASRFFVIFIPILFFSCITYWMKEQVSESWIRFTLRYLPIFWLITAVLSTQSHNGSMGVVGAINGALLGFVFLFTILIYITVSVSLIIAILFSLKKGK